MSTASLTKDPGGVRTEVTSCVALDPADWYVATWRPRPARPRPAAAPFDLDRCLQRLQMVIPGRGGFYAPWEWGHASIAPALTPAEAHFWFVAMTECSRDNKPQVVAPTLNHMSLTGELPHDEIKRRLRQRAGFVSEAVMGPLSNLLPLAELLALLLEPDLFAVTTLTPHYQLTGLQLALVSGFKNFVRPYLDDADMEQLRQTVRECVNPSLWSQAQPPSLDQLMAYRLAPVLGMHRELQVLVSTWADNQFPRRNGGDDYRRMPREQIFGLGNPWQVEQHIRRLGLSLRNPGEARAWLAHTGVSGVDYLVSEIRSTRQKHAAVH